MTRSAKYKSKLSKEQRQEIVKEYDNGNGNITLHELAEKYQCSHVAVYKWIKKAQEVQS